MEIVAERITTPEGVGGFVAYPKAQKSPAVLVNFEIFGVNSHMESVCRRLAEAGYAALAPDYYWRLDTKTAPYSDMKGGFALASTLKDDQIMSDAGSAIRYLQSQPFVERDAIGTIGFCMGGRLSFLIAANFPNDISAAVSFYGGGLAGENMRAGQTLNPVAEASKVRCPVLLFYGEKDQFILPEHVQKFTGRLKELGKKFESKIYPGAGHGFFCDDRASYEPKAAKDSWQRVLEFFEKNLTRAKAEV
ncbi:MAG: dienelactone hydrolase family protein [Acidobacteria bacterium]|nr:dienelactone hydrolase family protein [Acidobacteriota bacterium]